MIYLRKVYNVYTKSNILFFNLNIMHTSILLARIIWPLVTIVGLSLIINTGVFKNMVKDFWENYLFVYLSGLFAYVLWAIIIANHNVWNFSWYVLITILWYICLIKWISLILFPTLTNKMFEKFKISKSIIKNIWIFYFAIGLYVFYLWFKL